MKSPVMEALRNADDDGSAMFDRWCLLRGVSSLPAAPADVAAFIADCASLGPDGVWRVVREISHCHTDALRADPTLGPPASTAMNALSQIKAPRSWPQLQKGRFLDLPYDLQLYLVEREAQRDNEVRRAQNAVAIERQKKVA